MKRTHKQVLRDILGVLGDGKLHSYSELERKVNTNWKTIRDQCDILELFETIKIEENKVKITLNGNRVLRRLD